ncbi:MAG TPA: ATP-binding protein [Candidatus Krumholzibacteria bacterium]|nr:ATP-binding protein [Candidatus Krumholzibacteria bacterium]HPD70925.1 ATP-binding protein [Candidatus Krumholzibacteria bacterium]HRY39375.1 ATP-binding protein [Candidatus Krumholzibacteria bacterium]
MDQQPETPNSQAGVVHRILAAAHGRLEGRWEDPAAWAAVCEETASVWRCWPGVRWAAVAARGGLGRLAGGEDVGDQAAVWVAADGRVAWRTQPFAPAFWAALDDSPHGQLQGRGEPALNSSLFSAAEPRSISWLAQGVPGGRSYHLALVVGLATDLDDRAAARALGVELALVIGLLAPLLGQHRRLADLSAEVAAVRSECETLSRLGELRARLAAVTAHELKTPLTSITAYAEVLQQQGEDPAFSHGPEFLRVIRSEADRLLRLVDRLLDSSRRGRLPALTDLAPVAAGPLVEEVLRTMAPQAAARDLQLVGRVPADLPRIDGDPDLIRQVLLNLLGNALKFTPPGGRVVVTAREDATMVRLAVSDNGPGIPPQELRAIFQSFYRTRAASHTEGIGLGLSIVKEIASLHGGHVDVHSRFGRGSTFGALLPKERRYAGTDSGLTARCFDPLLQERLCRHTLRLVGELAVARGVGVLLPSVEPGGLVVGGSMGLDPRAAGLEIPASGRLAQLVKEPAMLVAGTGLLHDLAIEGSEPAGSVMLAPFELGATGDRGLILAARRLGGGIFGVDDLGLLKILAEILGKAWSASLAAGVERREIDAVAEALAALSGLRQSGVPTADPLAFRVLSRTGRRLGLSSYEIRLLQYAGALHDAGMVLLDPDVVLKPERLDVDERDHVVRHPQRGIDLLGPLVALPELQAVIRHHHERVDGRGYPDGQSGEAIPLGARILAVVDAFFAMIRSRPWREGLPVAAAVAEIRRYAGTQFDERVVVAFLGVLSAEGLLSDAANESPVSGGARR